MQIVDRGHNLLDSLRSIELGELSLVANSVKKLSTGCQLRHDIKLVLHAFPVSLPAIL